MVMVRSKKAHTNEYGDAVEKNEGDVYSIHDADHADLLARLGVVEVVADKPSKTKTDEPAAN